MKRRGMVTLLGLVVLAATLAAVDGAAAAGPAVERAAQTPNAGGAIAGRITDARDGSPLAGAVVSVTGTRYGTTSGADGSYRITGVPEGNHAVRVRRIGYQPLTKEVTVAGAAQAALDFAMAAVPTQLDEVVVTGSLGGAQAKAIPAALTVVSADHLEDRNYTRVIDIFNGDVPGVTANTYEYYDFAAGIAIRGSNGLTGSTATILIDGIPVANSWYITQLDPASVERIEVLRGPQASTIYGASATGGVINFFTKKGYQSRRPEVEAKVSGGYIQSPLNNAKLTDNTVSLLGGSRDWTYRLQGGYTYREPWVDEGFDKTYSVNGSVRGTQGPLDIEANFRYFQRYFGWPLGSIYTIYSEILSGTYIEDDYARQQSYNAHAVYRATPRWKHDLLVGYDRNKYDYMSAPHRGLTYSYNDTIPSNWSYGGEDQLTTLKYSTGWDAQFGKRVTSQLIAGVDYQAFDQDYVYFGVTSRKAPEGTWTFDQPFIDAGGYTGWGRVYASTVSGYVQEQFGIGNFYLTGGLRGDRQSILRTSVGWIWSPRVGAAFTIPIRETSVKLRTAYGSSAQPPPWYAITDDISTYYVRDANPNIRPKRLTGWDVGVEAYFGRRAVVAVSYYRQTNKDDYDPVYDYSSFPYHYQYQNIGTVQNNGWEIDGRLNLGRLILQANYSPVHSFVKTLDEAYSGVLKAGQRTINTPSYTASFTPTLTLPKSQINAQISFTGTKRNWDAYTYFAYYMACYAGENDCSQPWQSFYNRTYKEYYRVALNASHYFTRRAQGFLSVTNLLNSRTLTNSNYYTPKGRTTTIGFRWKP